MKERKIIQASYPGTASTVLVNILNGLICPEKPVRFGYGCFPAGFSVVKTHLYDKSEDAIDGEFGIDHWIRQFSKKYDLYFICAERKGSRWRTTLHKKYHSYDNVLRIPYEDLLETPTYSVPDLVNHVCKQIENFLPPDCFNLNKEAAIDRIVKMNALYQQIKNKPFSYFNNFFHIHGSHRGSGAQEKNATKHKK